MLKTIAYQNYSKRRKKEIEADSLGLAFYQKTVRNPKAALTLLEKLDFSDGLVRCNNKNYLLLTLLDFDDDLGDKADPNLYVAPIFKPILLKVVLLKIQ